MLSSSSTSTTSTMAAISRFNRVFYYHPLNHIFVVTHFGQIISLLSLFPLSLHLHLLLCTWMYVWCYALWWCKGRRRVREKEGDEFAFLLSLLTPQCCVCVSAFCCTRIVESISQTHILSHLGPAGKSFRMIALLSLLNEFTLPSLSFFSVQLILLFLFNTLNSHYHNNNGLAIHFLNSGAEQRLASEGYFGPFSWCFTLSHTQQKNVSTNPHFVQMHGSHEK